MAIIVCLQRLTCRVFFRSQVVQFRCCTTVVSCAFTTYVCTAGVYNLFDLAGRIMITSMKHGRVIDFLLLIAVL